MMTRAVMFVIALSAIFVASCKEDPVVLATLPPPEAPAPEERCSAEECPRGTYCDKPACDAPAGTCLPFPTVCPPLEDPVCGCDGITYFNDCLRRAAGAVAAHPGECERAARPCRAEAECPPGAVCSLLVGIDQGECREPRGRCWVLPAECPRPMRPDRWQPCVPAPPGPEPPPPLPCLDTCNAILTGTPHTRALRCE